MRPSRANVLLVIALAAAVVVWAVLRVIAAQASTLPRIPVATAVVVALMGAGVLVAAFSLRGRIHGRPGVKPLPALASARYAVLGKATAHVGALLTGGYLGFTVFVLLELDGEARQVRLLPALATVAAALLVLVAGLVLEHFCRLPPDDESSSAQSSTGSGGASRR